MLLSKIWLFLITTVAAAGLALALLLPKPASRSIAQAIAENLDRSQHNSDLVLRLEARDWIDAVAKMAWDGTIIDQLEAASNKRVDPKQAQAKINGRLLSLVARLKSEIRPQLLVAVDYRGKQIARIGPGEERYTPGEDGLAGYPLVESALRGFRGDDTWSVDGKLFLMAASPVIARAKGRYVGALLLGHEVGEPFARRLKARLAGTDLAFFLRGKMVSATVSTFPELTKLPLEFAKRRQQILRDGRSPSIRIGAGSTAHNIILAPLPGEAAEHDAFYVAIGAPTPRLGLGELVGLVQGSDLSWDTFPWLLLAGSLLAALILGIALLAWAADLPLRRLVEATSTLAKREGGRLEERGFSGRFRAIAVLFNEAMDRIGRQAKEAARAAPAEAARHESRLEPLFPSSAPGVEPLGSIGLGGRGAPPPLAVQDSGLRDFVGPGSGIEDSFGSGLDPLPEDQAFDFEDIRPRASSPGGEHPLESDSPPGEAAAAFNLEPLLLPHNDARPAESDFALPERRLRLDTGERDTLSPGLSPVAPLSAAPAGDSGILSLPDSALLPLEEPPSEAAAPGPSSLATSRMPSVLELPSVPLPAPSPPPAKRPSVPELPSVPFPEPERTAPPATSDAEPTAEEREAYLEQVFNEFLMVKRQCGESVSNLTFERFAVKLRKNRDDLIARYGCQSVRFQVYIKDGRAALKASPIKD